MLRKQLVFFIGLASVAACAPSVEIIDTPDSGHDASTGTDSSVDAPGPAPHEAGTVDASSEASSDAGVDATHVTNDASPDAADAAPDAADAADASPVDAAEAGTVGFSILLTPAVNASVAADPAKAWETDTVTVKRSSSTSKIWLASGADGTGQLYVDDNIHVIVTPQGGTAADQYYEFWSGYPCPAESTTLPPGGNGSGGSVPIDMSALFSTDTSTPQSVSLEFWHCVTSHSPSHGAFYLVEK